MGILYIKENINFMFIIYSLSSSSNPDNIRYIGKTKNIKDRLRRHIGKYYLNNEKTYKNNWIKSEISNGNKIIIKEIERIEDNWEEREKYWISHFLNEGYKLTNLTKGGEGIPLTDEIIKKRNESNKKSKRRKKAYKETYLKYEGNKEIVELCGIHESNGVFIGTRICPSCSKEIEHKSKTIIGLIRSIKIYILNNRECHSCKSSGPKNYFYGKKLNDGKKKQEKYGVKILQYDLDGNLINEFNSIREASEKTGIDRKSISNCSKNIKHYNTAGGFKFKRKEK